MVRIWNEKYEVGTRVLINNGEFKGEEAIYGGLHNNSNWHILTLPSGVHLMNTDEFEEIVEVNTPVIAEAKIEENIIPAEQPVSPDSIMSSEEAIEKILNLPKKGKKRSAPTFLDQCAG